MINLKMPVWSGMQNEPNKMRAESFCVFAPETGPIKQYMDDDLANRIVRRYGQDDYNFITAPPGKTIWSEKAGRARLAFLEPMIPKKLLKNVLEIGSGTTWFAREFCDKFNPKKYTCIDPTLKADSTDKIKAIMDYFPSEALMSDKFDLILAYNLLEHVPDPRVVLLSIKDLLSSSGRVVITVPDCEGQLNKGDINCLVHEHMTYYSKNTLNEELETCGLNIIYQSSRNDLFTVVAEKDSKQKILTPKRNDKLLLENASAAFQSLFNDFSNQLILAFNLKKRICFHGATNGLNAFLYTTNLNKYDFSIFDGDKAKDGQFLPTCRKSIKHVSHMDYTSYDIIVISAMSFFDEIKASATESGYRPDQIVPMSVEGTEILAECENAE